MADILMEKALSRKGSSRGEEQGTNETTNKVIVKVVCSQAEELKQPWVPNEALLVVPNAWPHTLANLRTETLSRFFPNAHISDARDVKIRKLNRLMTLNPRRIFLLFATLSSMGTIVLIYFTLAMYQGQSVE